MLRSSLVAVLIAVSASPWAVAQDRETKVRSDRDRLKDSDLWVYNDFERGVAEAKESGKPLFVVFRCIPCEACSEFDKALLEDETEVRDLFDKFVCVRVVQGNGLDLSLFQFDYDQSFHAMFLNADKTIYGRYGTRSARPEHEDMTIKGLRQAMLAALELHKDYPNNKAALAGKQSQKAKYSVPEEMPDLKGKYGAKLDYAGAVVKSCIHCHQIRDSELTSFRTANKPIPAEVLYPYPLPEAIGLRMNPNTAGQIAEVIEGSIADKAGLKKGAHIIYIADWQPVISTADVQWALHNAPASGEFQVGYSDQPPGANTIAYKVTFTLPAGWRERSDISFRPTTWHLRGIATGGLVLEDLSDEARKERGLASDKLALRVKHVGQYGHHAAAKNAGFQKDDVITSIDGKSNRMTESQFLAVALKHPAGAKLAANVLRGGKTVDLKLPIQ
jgi:serine protease Do